EEPGAMSEEVNPQAEEPTAAAEPKAKKAPAKKPAAAKAPKAPAKAAAPKPKREGAQHDESRGRRKIREGIVVSNRMAKTVVVMVQRRTQHPLYGKVVIRSNKFKAHDEQQTCDIGDRVEIMETRPMSKEKRWRVTQILEKVK